MNTDSFINARKAKGLSQSELCQGICTQTTLSRFEKNGQVPSLKILIKLCTRLNLPISEVLPKIGLENSKTVKIMDQVEFNFITSEYDKAHDLLDSISLAEEELESDLHLRYLYLKGFLMIFQNESVTDTLFTFDQILLDEKIKESDIYKLLAYTGVGMTYSREKEFLKAEYYFNKVIEKIYYCPTKKIEDTWRVLNIVFHSGVFYAEINELAASNALLEYAVEICSENHITYYLARAAFQLALNSVVENKNHEKTLELLYDARAYAKINKNKVLLEKIAELELVIIPKEKQW